MPFAPRDKPDAYTRKIRRRISVQRPALNWITAQLGAIYVGVSIQALRKHWRTHGLHYFNAACQDYVRVEDLRAWVVARQLR